MAYPITEYVFVCTMRVYIYIPIYIHAHVHIQIHRHIYIVTYIYNYMHTFSKEPQRMNSGIADLVIKLSYAEVVLGLTLDQVISISGHKPKL